VAPESGDRETDGFSFLSKKMQDRMMDNKFSETELLLLDELKNWKACRWRCELIDKTHIC